MLSLSPTSIAARLTVQVILFSTALAVIATCVQLFLDYRQELRNIRGFFTLVAETSVRPMEESVWILDDLQINLQLEGLTRRQDIVYAAVSMDGRIAWAKGAPPEANGITHTFPLVYTTGRGPEKIGELQVAASLDGVHRRLLRRVVILLCSNGVKTFLVAGFLLLLFRRTIAGRLTRLAEHVQAIDLRRGDPAPLVLERPAGRDPDEMDRAATALNDLCRSGAHAFADLRLQEQRLRLLFDATSEAIFGVDGTGCCTFANRVGLDGFLAGEPIALVGADLPALLDQQCVAWAGQRRVSRIRAAPCACRPRPATRKTLPCRPDGRPLQLSVRCYPVVEAGLCTGAVAFFADTSASIGSNRKNSCSGHRRADPDPHHRCPGRGHEQLRVTGAEAAAIIGVHAFDYLPALRLQARAHEIRTAIGSGLRGPAPWRATRWPPLHPGGAGLFHPRPERDRLTHVVAMSPGTSARERELTAHLQHAQKMELLGRMTASLAHEFGNPLLGIRYRPARCPAAAGTGGGGGGQPIAAAVGRRGVRPDAHLIRELQPLDRPSSERKTPADLLGCSRRCSPCTAHLPGPQEHRRGQAFGARHIRLRAVEDQLRRGVRQPAAQCQRRPPGRLRARRAADHHHGARDRHGAGQLCRQRPGHPARGSEPAFFEPFFLQARGGGNRPGAAGFLRHRPRPQRHHQCAHDRAKPCSPLPCRSPAGRWRP